MRNEGERSGVEAGAEQELITAARNGDTVAFGRLVAIHQNGAFTLAYRLTADRHLAEDVTQEALIRAWRALPNFRGEARFSTWLHRIVVNTAWTHTRRARRRAAVSWQAVGFEPEATGPGPEQAVDDAADRAALEAALARLPDAQRAIIVMKDVYEWSHEEIAASLGITVGAGKVRLHRARRRLRDLLWEER